MSGHDVKPRPGSIVDYEGNRAIIGDRVELHPATDWWMRGARFGIIKYLKTRTDGQPVAAIRLDNYPKRAIHFLGRDFRRSVTNPRAVHSAKFDRCVRKVKRRRGGKRARNAFAVCTSALGKKAFRKKRRNPSRYKGRGEYVVTAQKRGGKLLRLVEGNKFAERGAPVVFPTERAASATARWLRRTFPVLRAYNPKASPR